MYNLISSITLLFWVNKYVLYIFTRGSYGTCCGCLVRDAVETGCLAWASGIVETWLLVECNVEDDEAACRFDGGGFWEMTLPGDEPRLSSTKSLVGEARISGRRPANILILLLYLRIKLIKK